MPNKDPEQRRLANLRHRQKHRAKIAAKSRAYHASNKEARNAYHRAYHAAHRETFCIKMHEYGIAHKQEKQSYNKQYKERNGKTINAHNRQYRRDNYEKRRTIERKAELKYRLANKALILRRNRESYALDPSKPKAAQSRHRALKLQAPVSDLSAAQWQEIKRHYGYRCIYCGRKMQRLSQDHITPLAKGGSHTASNIVPACISCNSRKHIGPPLKPIQPLLLTLAPKQKRKKG